jgi:hypothetical protein
MVGTLEKPLNFVMQLVVWKFFLKKNNLNVEKVEKIIKLLKQTKQFEDKNTNYSKVYIIIH